MKFKLNESFDYSIDYYGPEGKEIVCITYPKLKLDFGDFEDTIADYEFEIDKYDVESTLGEWESKENNISDDDLEEYIKSNFDELLTKYDKRLKDHYEEDAKEEAIDNYDFNKNNYWD